MALTFQSASKEDIPQLVSLLADDHLGAQREDVSLPLNAQYLDAFDNILKDPNNDLIIVMNDQQIAGMMQLTFIPYLTHIGSWRCLIEGVRIAKDFRGEGLGESMINWAIEKAKEKCCHIVQLTSDKLRPDAIRFYQKLGFEASHEGFKLKLSY